MFLLTIHYEDSIDWANTIVAICSSLKHCQKTACKILSKIVLDLHDKIDMKVISSLVNTNDKHIKTVELVDEEDRCYRSLEYNNGWIILQTSNKENRYCARYDQIKEIWQQFTLS